MLTAQQKAKQGDSIALNLKFGKLKLSRGEISFNSERIMPLGNSPSTLTYDDYASSLPVSTAISPVKEPKRTKTSMDRPCNYIETGSLSPKSDNVNKSQTIRASSSMNNPL